MTAAPARPNIVLVVIDALRADATEPFGAPPGASPEIARLAARGEAVHGVRATASWTLPSHTAMFTSQLARGLGLGQAPGQTPQSAAPVLRAQRERLLAEVLRRAGYTTWGVTTNSWAGRSAGFDTGFEAFTELDTSRHAQLGGGWRERIRWDLESLGGRADDGARQAEEVIARWLRSGDARPFFLFVNLLECHSPYMPPRPFADGGAWLRLRAADEAFRYLTFDAILRTCVGAQAVPPGALARMRRLYAASVRHADAWLGRLMHAIDERGELERTLVLVCSDHGENLGEGGLLAHSLSLDDRLLRVPFIAAGPGAGAFVHMRSLAQLAPLLATAIALPDHPWRDGLVEGLPVAQWDGYRLPADALARYAAVNGLSEAQVAQLTTPLTAAVSDRFKLVRGDDGDERLYDLTADPLELTPLRDEGAMVARAGEHLEAMRAAVRHPAAQAQSATTPDVSAGSPGHAVGAETTDLERKMRLLGYM